MPRVARSIISNIPYHIIHRGNNRQKIFFSKKDYKYFLCLLKEARKKYKCKLYSYVLMPNHIHLLLESPHISENLAKYVKLIAQKYTQYTNKINKRTGTLWEGRFKSSPVSRDSYLLALTRYIEMNPVRAQIVKDPNDYKWSSYSVKIGQKKNSLLDFDFLYLNLGKNNKERQANYQKWFKESIPRQEWDLIRRAINKSGVFGSGQFKKKLEGLSGRKFNLRNRGRPKKDKK